MIQRLSQVLRNFSQTRYNSIVWLCGYNDFYLDVWFTFVLYTCVYWTIGGVYTFIDLTKWPKSLYKYKLQNTQVTISDIYPALKQVLFNSIVVNLLMTLVGHKIRIYIEASVDPEIPTLFCIIYSYIVFEITREFAFYYGHRLMHWSVFYKYIHKRHHEWHSPISITAVYCHPVEHVLVNLTPIMIGPILLRSHRFTFWLWLIYVLFFTLNKHSGYEFPYFPSSAFHNYHHEKFNQNYGLVGFLDRFHGTDDKFRQTEASKRHGFVTHFKLQVIRFPDVFNSAWLSLMHKKVIKKFY